MLEIRKVTEQNVWKLLQLHVRREQENFVATNTESIVEAYTTLSAGGVALCFGIYEDETPVGFAMVGFGHEDWEEAPKVAAGNYSVWRYMIDEKYQGKGYGRKGLQLVLDYIKTFPCGKAKYCFLSYEPENEVAKSLYHSFGFQENGEMDEEEVVAVLPLKG